MVGNGRRKQPIWVPPPLSRPGKSDETKKTKTENTIILARQLWRKSQRKAPKPLDGIEKFLLATEKTLQVSVNDNLHIISSNLHIPLLLSSMGPGYRTNIVQVQEEISLKILKEMLFKQGIKSNDNLLSPPAYSSHCHWPIWTLDNCPPFIHITTSVKLDLVEKSTFILPPCVCSCLLFLASLDAQN